MGEVLLALHMVSKLKMVFGLTFMIQVANKYIYIMVQHIGIVQMHSYSGEPMYCI